MSSLTGHLTCDDCNYSFEWMAMIPEYMLTRSYTVHILNKPIANIYGFNENEYRLCIYCPSCGKNLFFVYER
ncbi:hypothetical protein FTV88_3301 [Heliorestis convoluta]|uniref:Uncharacterized protein n=1 Tax=Heliorestis convoluta TaxID=356322 RepID=A0A5Q2N3I5_9FIRM|nr:hypothetical protein FTV88_3301 [Heliorestis convoluta]